MGKEVLFEKIKNWLRRNVIEDEERLEQLKKVLMVVFVILCLSLIYILFGEGIDKKSVKTEGSTKLLMTDNTLAEKKIISADNVRVLTDEEISCFGYMKDFTVSQLMTTSENMKNFEAMLDQLRIIGRYSGETNKKYEIPEGAAFISTEDLRNDLIAEIPSGISKVEVYSWLKSFKRYNGSEEQELHMVIVLEEAVFNVQVDSDNSSIGKFFSKLRIKGEMGTERDTGTDLLSPGNKSELY